MFGIDFGTSNCTMADVRDGRAVVIRDEEGLNKTPSVVFFGEQETLVGQPAVNLLKDAGGDPLVQARLIVSIKRNLLSPPRIALPGGRLVRPVEVASEILAKLKRDAENARGPVRRAVITYPAIFDGDQARAVLDAAAGAGFDEVDLLEEPVAAAIAFEHGGGHVGQGVLICDWGGGTFDVAFVVRDEGEHEFSLALPPEGELCGGDDLDQLLYDRFDAQARRELGRPIVGEDGDVDLHFLRMCRRRKENLSKSRHASFSTLLQGGDRLSSTIGRDEFEALISPTVDRTIRLTTTVAEQAREAGYPVDTVLLVGGSSQVPLMSRRIGEALGIKPQSWRQHDVAVALGAAYHAEAVWGERKLMVSDPVERYRRSVEMVWSDGRLEAEEAERLRILADELGIGSDQAAQIERDITGRTNEETLGQAAGKIDSDHADESPYAAVDLGVLLAEEGDVAGARAAYQRAIDSGHADMAPRAAFNLGVLLEGQGDVEGARAFYRRAIDSGHADEAPYAAFNLGVLLEGQGDAAGARAFYERAIDSGHADQAPKSAVNLGWMLSKQGDVEGARAAFQRAIDSGHADRAPYAAVDLGWVLAEQGDVAGARAAYQHAIDSEHADMAPRAAFNLGVLLEGQGDVEGARAAYQRAIDSGHADMTRTALEALQDLGRPHASQSGQSHDVFEFTFTPDGGGLVVDGEDTVMPAAEPSLTPVPSADWLLPKAPVDWQPPHVHRERASAWSRPQPWPAPEPRDDDRRSA